ncbi:YDG/SRA domain-containing protein [Actinophytocola sediminis]
MGLSDVTSESVLKAVEDYDRRGAEGFRAFYGFGPAQRLILMRNGRAYDAKAIVGVAHGYATGTFWRSADFTGGVASVIRTLQKLGFDARHLSGLPQPDSRAIFGEVTGYPEGSTFRDRAEVQRAGVHRPGQAGICGTKAFGAESIVISGGYEDDEDLGDLIIYTGHGGQDTRRRQVEDQTFDDPGNAALRTSSLTGEPIRVVRGRQSGSTYAPASGYRYDGLYRAVDAWMEAGRSGHQVCRFRLVKAAAVDVPDTGGPGAEAAPTGTVAPGRRTSTVQRIVRSTAVSRHVKQLHDDTCQACTTRLSVAGRGYSEGAHIRPLGLGHNGPDVPANTLCLCPNCHVLFDSGALIIDDAMQVWVNGIHRGPLAINNRHAVGNEYLAYHREHYGAQTARG